MTKEKRRLYKPPLLRFFLDLMPKLTTNNFSLSPPVSVSLDKRCTRLSPWPRRAVCPSLPKAGSKTGPWPCQFRQRVCDWFSTARHRPRSLPPYPILSQARGPSPLRPRCRLFENPRKCVALGRGRPPFCCCQRRCSDQLSFLAHSTSPRRKTRVPKLAKRQPELPSRKGASSVSPSLLREFG